VAGGTGVVGRYAVEAARSAGHETVVISRANGVDLTSVHPTRLADALDGVDVIIDASNVNSMSRKKATAYFTTATANLQRAGGQAGVKNLVTISIVNIDQLPGNPYYRAKLAQEQAARAGPVPVTILRATQFHEFAAQVMQRVKLGSIRIVPRFRVQTVAARTVGEVAVELAATPPEETTIDLAGPEQAELVDQARATARRLGLDLRIIATGIPGRAGRDMKAGALIPSGPARIAGPSFEEWLPGPDVEAVYAAR